MARQSLISAFSPADTSLLGEVDADSAFQRRMLENDWRASLVPLLEAKATEIDVLLWDLCDERLGVRELGDGSFVTRSVDLMSTGVDARLGDSTTPVDFGSPRHRGLWEAALVEWRAALERCGLLGRLILVAPPWAESALDGAKSPTSFGRTARDANSIFADYHRAAVRELGCPIVTISEAEARSDPDHQWGLAPFHYSPSNYGALADRIDAAGSRFQAKSAGPR